MTFEIFKKDHADNSSQVKLGHEKLKTSCGSTFSFKKSPGSIINFNNNKSDAFLNDSTVYTQAGELIPLSELWRDKTVVLKVLPRLGCKFCKYEAQSLSDLSLMVDPNKVAIVAVCYTDPDLATFLADGYWSWSIFLDPHREVYKKARLYRVSRWQMLKDLVERRIWSMNSFIDSKFTFTNTTRGDPYQLGGTFVIAPGGHVQYQFRPTKLAMYPSLKEIYQTLGGDPDDIADITPKTNVYSQREASIMYSHRSSSSCTSDLSFKSHYSSPNLLYSSSHHSD